MKKICKTMLVVFMAVFMVLATAACGNNGGSSNVIGTWKMKIDSSKVPEEQQAMVAMMETGMDMTMTFSEGGKVTANIKMDLMGQSSESSAEGTWSQEGDKINISGTKTEGAAMNTDGSFVIKDGKMYVSAEASVEGAEYFYFEKQ